MNAQQAWGTALLRVTLGVVFVMHGYVAVKVLGFETTTGLIVRMGYPLTIAPALTWYLIVVHIAGGTLMIVGLWTRLAALGQVPIMASAVFLLHLGQGFFMRGTVVDAAAGPVVASGYAYPLLVLVATLALALLGGGAASVDLRRATRRRIELP